MGSPVRFSISLLVKLGSGICILNIILYINIYLLTYHVFIIQRSPNLPECRSLLPLCN